MLELRASCPAEQAFITCRLVLSNWRRLGGPMSPSVLVVDDDPNLGSVDEQVSHARGIRAGACRQWS